jgi:hypothetical protein
MKSITVVETKDRYNFLWTANPVKPHIGPKRKAGRGGIEEDAPVTAKPKSKLWTEDMQKKYPGVKVDDYGWVDFGPHITVEIDVKGLTGDHSKDVGIANSAAKAAGIDVPLDHTWHHHPNEKTMQLIPKDLHGAWYHYGGASRLRAKNKE